MAQRTLPEIGKHLGRRTGQMVIYETPKGALCAAIPLCIVGGIVPWSGKTTATFGAQDGTIQQKTIDNFKRIFQSWDGVDLAAFQNIPLPEDPNQPEFEITGDHEEFTPKPTEQDPSPEPILIFKVRYLDPLGGGVNMPEPADLKAISTKWGSKLKALSGGAKKPAASKPATAAPAAAASAPATPAAPAKKAAASGPPGRKPTPASETSASPRTSSLEEVWTALRNATPQDVSDDDLSTKFYSAADEVAPGKNGELAPPQWGEVLTKLGL